MLDNTLIAAIISALNAGLAAIGQSSILVQQAYQPTQQGVNTNPTIYLYKIGDERMGSVYRDNVWNANTSTMVYTETQQYLTTFQFSALAIQDPSNTTSLTAADIVNYAAAVMQSLATITTLQAAGIGILKIGQVRNPPFVDDRGRYEYAPNFDCVFSTKQVISSTQPIINKTVVQVYDV